MMMRWLAVLLALALIGVGAQRLWPKPEEAPLTADLTGVWLREGGGEALTPFPERLDLRGGGTYTAPGGAATGAYWHGGDWSVEGETLRIQTANDAMAAYRIVNASDTVMVLTDPAGLTVTYRRE